MENKKLAVRGINSLDSTSDLLNKSIVDLHYPTKKQRTLVVNISASKNKSLILT